jgi:ATP-dependent Clp protease ATP-binding subunit ClpA
MPFERFTVKARQVVVTAQEEARLLKHSHIGTEHILLGLLDAPDSVAANVLHQLGYSKETALVDIAAVVKPGTEELRGHIPFSPRAKKTLELAQREALQLHHNYIGTEHILLALVREGEGVGAKVLAERINPISKIRAAVLASLEGSPDVAAGPWPTGTPATEDTVSTASALAGGAPVGSHHLLEAMLRAENSMAARVLRELGVDPDAVAAKIDELDPETTTDANPEEAAARKMEIRLVDDEVHLILRDPATVALAKKVTELSDGPIRGVGPVAGMFVPLWRSANQLLLQIQRVLEPEPEEEDGSAASKVAKVVRTVLAPRLRRRTG